MNKKGISRLQFIMIISGFVLLLVIGVLIIDYYRSKTRDAMRVADMAVLQSSMNRLYSNQASYNINVDCQPGMALKSEACSVPLLEYVNLNTVFSDPLNPEIVCNENACNENNQCAYTVGQVFDEQGYQIIFHLEKGINGLSKGCHILTQNGIQ